VLQKFEIKYGWKFLGIRSNFPYKTYSDSKWILNKKIGNSRSVFDFRKLIKISRNGVKIQEFS
jgi:hypothetical protein